MIKIHKYLEFKVDKRNMKYRCFAIPDFPSESLCLYENKA